MRYLDGQEQVHLPQGQVSTLRVEAHFESLGLAAGQLLHTVQLHSETLSGWKYSSEMHN